MTDVHRIPCVETSNGLLVGDSVGDSDIEETTCVSTEDVNASCSNEKDVTSPGVRLTTLKGEWIPIRLYLRRIDRPYYVLNVQPPE